ncbi:hypothetical protein Q3F29_11655, partial [Enterococcus faecium]|nr:hypothetical protein [Enterococcus faecium]
TVSSCRRSSHPRRLIVKDNRNNIRKEVLHLIKFVKKTVAIPIPNDIVNDGDTHNVIKGFMPLDLSTGRKIRFSEIQYEGIGFTLIDLKNSTFEIKEGLDLKNLLCADDKIKKIQLYKVPILTPTVLTMLEMENNINYIDSGSDLLIRWQVITNFLMELKKYSNTQTKFS